MQMLCTLAFSKDFAKSGRLAAISSRASHPGGETGWEHDPDPALIMRLCTLAATTACLIFDRRRERLGTTRSTPMLAHPTPSARILISPTRQLLPLATSLVQETILTTKQPMIRIGWILPSAK